MTRDTDLQLALEAWMREDVSMPDDLDEVLRVLDSTSQRRRWGVSLPARPRRMRFMFDTTRFAAALAVATLLGLVLAVAAPWDRTEAPVPNAAMSEAAMADGRMLAVHDSVLDDAALETAVAGAYAEDAFMRDVLPDSFAEASGTAEIAAMIDREEVWTREGELQVLDSLTDDLRYLGIYEVSARGTSDQPVATVACVVTVADELIQARECSRGGSSLELLPAQGVEPALEAADDRFLRALSDPDFTRLEEFVASAFAPEAVFGVYWHKSRVSPSDDVRRGRDPIRFKFSDTMVAERLEPPLPLPAEEGSLRYLGTYDFTYNPYGSSQGVWPGTVCSTWLAGDLIERMDCFLPADTVIYVAD
jgi:hypothetical protein